MENITDEQLIEWAKGFTSLSKMKYDNNEWWFLMKQRGLDEHIPRSRGGRPPGAKNKPKNPDDFDGPALRRSMYIPEYLDDGYIKCGRCLEKKIPGRKNQSICDRCYDRMNSLHSLGKDTNIWNIKDEFCHIVIRHYEKTFEIGIKVDEKLQNYLTSVGYGFIFKEVYIEPAKIVYKKREKTKSAE